MIVVLLILCDKMPQTVSANGGLSSTGAVWHILEIQALARSHGCALPGREPFLIGNLPRRLLPRFSAGVAPQRGLHASGAKYPAAYVVLASFYLP